MSRPYVPGVWAKGYEQLPRPQKDEVIRKVNKIFADRTQVTGKLDPVRDKDLVRLWLRIRDAVMSGGATVPALGAGALAQERISMKFDSETASNDPLSRGWIDLAGYSPSFSNPGPSRQIASPSRGSIDVLLDGKKYSDVVATLSVAIDGGVTFRRVLVQFNTPSLVTTLEMSKVVVVALSRRNDNAQFTLLPQTIGVSSD